MTTVATMSLAEFRALFHEDRVAGVRRPLADYLSIFPGNDDAIAIAYCSLRNLHPVEPCQHEVEIERRTSRRLATALDAAAKGLIDIDSDGRIEGMSATAESMTGYQQEHVIGRVVDAVLTNGKGQRIGLAESLRRGRSLWVGQPRRITATRKDGSTFPLEVSISAVEDDGRSGFSAILRDLSRERSIEQTLEDSQVRFEELQRIAHLGCWDWEISTGALHWSDEIFRIFGMQPGADEITFDAFLERIHPDDREGVTRRIEAAVSSDASYDTTMRILRPDGQVRHVHTQGSVYRDPSAGAVRMLGTVIDITERVRAEDEKRELQEQLIHAQKLETIGTLAGGVAHDFNNILAPIIGFTDLAASAISADSPAQQYLSTVENAAQRARELVKQILTFSRQHEHEKQPVFVHQIVKQAIRFCRASTPTSVELDIELNEELPPIMADATHIHQVVMNVLTNGCQAMADGGRLRVRLIETELDESSCRRKANLPAGKYAELIVADTGCGMDTTTLSRMFEPFFTTKPLNEGTGLGMSVAHGIVLRHGGGITAESNPGSGSTIKILLPLSDRTQQAHSESAAPQPSSGKERVLFVDDEAAIASLGKMSLESKGYEVESFVSGAAALAKLRETPDAFDILVSDLTMPEMSGTQLATEAARIRPDLPIVLTTGFHDARTAAATRHPGIREVLLKPLRPSEISDAIRRVLDEGQHPRHESGVS